MGNTVFLRGIAMPAPDDIKRKAKRVKSINEKFFMGKDRCQMHTYNSSSWWKSEAGKALRSEYSDIQADMTKLISSISKLEVCINKLADKVQQAIDERKIRTERRKTLETDKKK